MEIIKPTKVQTAFGEREMLTFVLTGRMTNSHGVFVATVPIEKIIDSMKIVLASGNSKAVVTDGDDKLLLYPIQCL
ncbi:hypothetical protein [Paenibacillus sp.]|uniref:hypothetical protein n=1 Tax=Paenibacillus sp. TaxID=58172 RepID=UPI0028B02431|nr:hypothetical protein [Paenibacillus sp.]